MRLNRFHVALLAANLALPLLTTAQEPPSPPPPTPVSPLAVPFVDFDFVETIDFANCQDLKNACAGLDWRDVLYGATLTPSHVGTCYAHRGNDPTFNYSAWVYVKQSWREGAKGWDGGTGAIGVPKQFTPQADAERQAGELLRQLCISGACCCPDLPAHQPCGSQEPVVAWDPASHNCCTFPNPCTVPTTWEYPKPNGRRDPRCG